MSTVKKRLEEAADKRTSLLNQAQSIIDEADTSVGLSDEQATEIDRLTAQAEDIGRLIDAIDDAPRMSGGFVFGEQSAPAPTGHLQLKLADGTTQRAFRGSEQIATSPLAGELGEMLHGALRGQPMNVHVGTTDSGGGYLIGEEFSSRFIDLARANSVCMSAGAATTQMNSSEMVIAGLSQDPTSHWRAETVKVTSSDLAFNKLTLRAKTLAAVVPCSIELIEDASNAPQIIESALSASMALEMDRVGLIGSGEGAEPTGLSNTSNVNSVASVGTPTNYDEASTAVGKILRANFNGDPSSLAWITHPRDGETYDQLKDTTNQPLQKPTWVQNLRPFSTTSLPTNLGGGSDESVSFVGDFSQMLLGVRRQLQIRIADDGSVTDSAGTTWNATDQLMKFIVAYLRMDVVILRPSFFCKLEGITE